MAQRLETDIVINLAGNLAQRANQLGNSMTRFAERNSRAMRLVRTTASAAGRGIDSLGNRYVGLATAFVTGQTVKNVAAFDAQMTRLGTNAKLTEEQVDSLAKSVREVSNLKDIRISDTDLASSADVLLGKTGDFEFVQDNLKNMGYFMQAFGADAQSTGAIFAQFKEKGIRDSEEVMRTIDMLYGQFAVGSVSVKDLASISEQLFSTYRGKGPEAIQQMGALVQLFAKAKGNANESLTSIQAVFAAFNEKQKVEFLNRQGIKVFKDGTRELREPVELLLEILDRAKNDPMKLGDVFDKTALEGLASLYDSSNKDLLKEMISDQTELGATQEASSKNAATLESAFTALNNSFKKFAELRLGEPIQDLADAINSVDEETVQNWLKWGETAVWTIGAIVALKKGMDLIGSFRGAFGRGGRGGGMGGDMGYGLGVQPVYVVNMRGGFNTRGNPPVGTPPGNTNRNSGTSWLPSATVVARSLGLGALLYSPKLGDGELYDADGNMKQSVTNAQEWAENQPSIADKTVADPERFLPKELLDDAPWQANWFDRIMMPKQSAMMDQNRDNYLRDALIEYSNNLEQYTNHKQNSAFAQELKEALNERYGEAINKELRGSLRITLDVKNNTASVSGDLGGVAVDPDVGIN